MLPALGQFAPTATPAPNASSPLRTTFRLGMGAASQTLLQKATIFVYYFGSLFSFPLLRALDSRGADHDDKRYLATTS